ncbi:MAG: nickel-dependent lactate racemase [Desulforhopalus sp.]|jgi:nickel-dependent lactate racemase
MNIQLEKGHSHVAMNVPGHKIADVLLGKKVTAVGLEVLTKKMRESLKVDLPHDITTKKIAVLIPDDTRLWARGDVFVSEIVKTLLSIGVPPENICVIIALGTHADMEQTKFPILAGDFAVETIQIFNSANKNQKRLVSFGKTTRQTDLYFTKEASSADHIIIFGGVLHHMLAGYGGGRKYIFPGIAGYESIQQNHSLAMLPEGGAHPKVRQTELAGNPVHEDIQEAAEIFLEGKGCTYVGVTANGQGEIFHVEVGGLEEAFSKSCVKLDEACCLFIEDKLDFALISAGGHRADGQLYQSTKALFNGVCAVKEGGRILFVAECADGIGNPIFESALRKYHNDPETLGRELVTSFNMPSYVAYRVIDLLNRFQITLLSGLSKQETCELGFKFIENSEIYVNNLTGKGYIIPFAENILPIVRMAEER